MLIGTEMSVISDNGYFSHKCMQLQCLLVLLSLISDMPLKSYVYTVAVLFGTFVCNF